MSSSGFPTSNTSFRKLLGRLPPAEQEEAYAKAAKAIGAGKVATRAAVIAALESILPSDGEFRIAFVNKAFRVSTRNKRTVRYLLSALESGRREPADTDPNLTIEHLLPQSPGPGREHVSDSSHIEMVDRLGNLALLEAPLNRALGNTGWTTKREALAKSAVESTSRTAEQASWDAETITHRQDGQAKRAVSIWRLDP